VSDRILPFEIAVSPVDRHGDGEGRLEDRLSKHGTPRASVDSNCVTAYFRALVLLI